MSKKFVPRLTEPGKGNNEEPYYRKRSSTCGGYNRCITVTPPCDVLPNCVGYAWGRFCEIQQVTDCKLHTGNATNWYSHTEDGYKRGKVPRLGAVACYSGHGEGHVAVVEKIAEDGTITCSNSGFNSKRRFFLTTHKPPDYQWGSGYTFQGFIYNPGYVPPKPTVKIRRMKFLLYPAKKKRRIIYE